VRWQPALRTRGGHDRAESLERRKERAVGSAQAESEESKLVNGKTRRQPGVAVVKDVKKSIEKERKMGHGLEEWKPVK